MIMVGIVQSKSIIIAQGVDTGLSKVELIGTEILIVFHNARIGCLDPEIGIAGMKARYFIIGLLFACGVAMTSCAASRGGCKTSQGFVGYGSR